MNAEAIGPFAELKSCARDIPWGSDPAPPVSLQAGPLRLKTVPTKLCRPGGTLGQEVWSGRLTRPALCGDGSVSRQ
jgi:hypothetical protein